MESSASAMALACTSRSLSSSTRTSCSDNRRTLSFLNKGLHPFCAHSPSMVMQEKVFTPLVRPRNPLVCKQSIRTRST